MPISVAATVLHGAPTDHRVRYTKIPARVDGKAHIFKWICGLLVAVSEREPQLGSDRATLPAPNDLWFIASIPGKTLALADILAVAPPALVWRELLVTRTLVGAGALGWPIVYHAVFAMLLPMFSVTHGFAEHWHADAVAPSAFLVGCRPANTPPSALKSSACAGTHRRYESPPTSP